MTLCLAGVDISAQTFSVCLTTSRGTELREFPNTARGHRALTTRLLRHDSEARVVVEATGIYHLQLTLHLAEQEGIEVMVLHPQVAHNFARSIAPRGKSDARDARTLLTYLERMAFEPWQPPAAELMQLRSLMRRTEQMAKEIRREKNRLHAMERDVWVDELVRSQCRERIERDEQLMAQLQARALELVREHDEVMGERATQLRSIPGVGERIALVLLAELGTMPEGLSVRQWVAQVGLDPCERTSGTSVRTRPRISKRGNRHVRRVLFLTAMTASRFCEPVARYKEHLESRGKSKKQALVAIMRKLVHCIYGMFKHSSLFDAEKFWQPQRAPSASRT